MFLADFDGTPNSVDLIYFDAFGPRVQPELWEKPIFEKFFGVMKTNGVFVTYCAKGQVRRDLIAAGFQVDFGPSDTRCGLPARHWKSSRATPAEKAAPIASASNLSTGKAWIWALVAAHRRPFA